MKTNNLGHIALLAIVAVFGQGTFAQTGSRTLPTCYEPGVSFAVSVTITLNNAPGWGAEERVPQGWSVTGINNGGSFSAAQSRVRWLSLSEFNGPLTLSYTVTPPSNANGVQSFSGDFSIDGTNAPTTGSASISKCEAPCNVSISSDQTVSSPAGSATFNITAGGPWSVSSNQAWATVSPASGTGNGPVTVTYGANTGTTQRSATITVSRTDCSGGSDTALLRQDPPNICGVSLSEDRSVTSGASSVTFNLTTSGAWSVASNQSWARVSPSSGRGNGAVTVTYDQNNDSSQRSAEITASRTDCTGGSDIAVLRQSGKPACTVTLSADQTVPSTANAKTFTVTASGPWSVSSSESWATVTPTSGTGNGSVQVSYGVNEGTSARTTTLTATRTDCTGGTDTALLTQNPANVECAIGAPSSVEASDGLFLGKVRVSWSPVNGATGYRVYRGAVGSNFSNAALVGSIAANVSVFDDSPVPVGTDEWTIEMFGCQTSVPSGEEPPFPYAQCGAFTGGVFGFPYAYWVTAIQDECESEPSAPDEGYSFKSDDEAARLTGANMGDLSVFAALGLLLLAAKGFGWANRRKLMS
jgi:hypothetical protein